MHVNLIRKDLYPIALIEYLLCADPMLDAFNISVINPSNNTSDYTYVLVVELNIPIDQGNRDK